MFQKSQYCVKSTILLPVRDHHHIILILFEGINPQVYNVFREHDHAFSFFIHFVFSHLENNDFSIAPLSVYYKLLANVVTLEVILAILCHIWGSITKAQS